MLPWLFNVYVDPVMEGREWRLPGLLYGELEEYLRVMVEWFVKECRRGLSVNTGKIKVMVLNGV